MNPAQNRKYWFEWARLRDVLISRGMSRADAESFREKLTVRALGYAKPHITFTSDEFTEWLKKCTAAREPASLDAQMEIENSQEACRARLLERCMSATRLMWSDGNDARLMHERACEGYVRGTARKIAGKDLEECTNAELGKVLGALVLRLNRLRRECAERVAAAQAAAAARGGSTDGGNPF